MSGAADVDQTGLLPGERAPDITFRKKDGNLVSLYDRARGGALVVLFYPNHGDAAVLETLQEFAAAKALMREAGAQVFTVSGDSVEATAAYAAQSEPGDFVVSDPDRKIAESYGAANRLVCYVLDPTQRVYARLEPADGSLIDRALSAVEEIGPPTSFDAPPHAPILVVPNALSPDECRMLIDYFESHDKDEGGTWRSVDGKMVNTPNYGMKRRMDHVVNEPEMQARLLRMLGRRVIPEIAVAFQCKIAHAEEFKLVRYDAETGGYFRPHRDNTLAATAHRQFAMTLNLNSEEYDGGELTFPEFGGATYKPGSGAAVVFSCSLMHEAHPVTRGSRYVLLSFFFDAEHGRMRSEFAEKMQRAAGAG